jgi:hypothetical protein
MEKHSVFVYDTPYDNEDEADEATFRKNDNSAFGLRDYGAFPETDPPALSEWPVTRPESAGRLYNVGGVRPLWQRYDYTSRWITSVLPTNHQQLVAALRCFGRFPAKWPG